MLIISEITFFVVESVPDPRIRGDVLNGSDSFRPVQSR